MFKSVIVVFITFCLLFIPFGQVSSRGIDSDPVPSEFGLIQPIPVTLNYACIVPFLDVYIRIYFGWTKSTDETVTIVLKDNTQSVPFDVIIPEYRNMYAEHTDEFFLDLSSADPIQNFEVHFTDSNGVDTMMKFHLVDFEDCDL